MSLEKLDDIIIGGGKAGKTLAPALVAAGRKTALVERRLDMIGGTCINVACIPTKTMIASALTAKTVRSASNYGVVASGGSVDLSAIVARKRAVVLGMRQMNFNNLKTPLGENLIIGTARFLSPKVIEVVSDRGEVRTLTAERFFVNTGTRPLIPALPGLLESGFLTSETLLEQESLPDHLVVLGSGSIGLEFAQMFRSFGSRVTVLGRGKQILSQFDSEIAGEVQRHLESEGIEFVLNSEALSVQKRDSSVLLKLRVPDGEKTVEGSHLLVAVGRAPVTEELHLDAAGVERTHDGFIKVNDRLETNVHGIWALGDVNGGPQFTHASLDDFRIVKANLIDGVERSTTGRLIPSCLFLDPEVSHVGLTEADAREKGLDVQIARLEASAVPRAKTLGKTAGLLKAVVDKDSKKILGCTLFCQEAGEVITTVQLAMAAGLPYTVLKDFVIAHPTMTEGLNMLFAKVG